MSQTTHSPTKVVLVTGGASGIGRAIVEMFAREPYRVVLADINIDGGQRVAQEVGATFIHSDLTQRQDCRHLVQATLEQFGRVDILVNVAGFQHIDPVDVFPEDVWDRMLAVMLTAPFLLTRYVWPGMKSQGWGRIINIASIHGLVASPFKSAYVAAKHGLIGLTRTTALEGGPLGITVNAIAPAYVRTPLVEKQIADQARTRGISEEEVIERVMLEPAAIKRLIEPDEVAAMVRYLCSEEARNITGAVFTLDAGWTAR